MYARNLWVTKVEEVVRAFAAKDAESQQLALTRLEEQYGRDAAAEAERLFVLKRAGARVPVSPVQPQDRQVLHAGKPVSMADALNNAIARRRQISQEPKSESNSAPSPSATDAVEMRITDVAPAQAPALLSPNAPFDTAKVFARHRCHVDGVAIVWFWQGQFWRWNGRFYAVEPDEVIRGQVYEFLDSATKFTTHGTARFQPTSRHVNEVLDALKSGLALGAECQPPMWLSTQQPATEWIVFRNGIVNVRTGELRKLSPDLWVQSALTFDWDPGADAPTWERFLQDVFPDDDEDSKEFLEEWMGYCMTEETCFQKGAMLIGVKRSGKGTISHVLRQMVGDASYVGLSFSTWTSTENSGECLIGKRVGVFADVRFKPGRAYGSSFDPGGIGHVSAERLLNIIGEDTITLGRKHIRPWHGQLRLKIILISNEVPNLNDASGVLPSRFLKLHFGVSFYGKEDVTLRERLSTELSGIAARCVCAYQRLCARGRFVQPRSAAVLERDVLVASDPFTAMALECFVPDPAGIVTKTVAYNRFQNWCWANHREDVLRSIPNNKFGDKLRAVVGFDRLGQVRPGGQGRAWVGMRLLPAAET